VTIMRSVLMAAAVLGIAPAFMQADVAEAAPKVCKLEIGGNDMMQFDKKELKVAADCTEVEVVLKHTGKLPATSMGHNWVLSRTADASAVSTAGMTAGPKSEYVVPNDKRVIAKTRLIGGGQTTSVRFPASKLKKGEAYTFQCTFPGHSALMKGKLIFG
jgi:azurin